MVHKQGWVVLFSLDDQICDKLCVYIKSEIKE